MATFYSIACATEVSILERTKQWGEIVIKSPDHDDLLRAWEQSVKSRGMSQEQFRTLLDFFLPQFLAASTMRNNAQLIFGNDIELGNSRLIGDYIVMSDDLTMKEHFRFMAKQQQRVVRAEIMGHLLGKLYDDVTVVKRDRTMGKLTNSARVMCPGYTVSILRIMVVFAPMLVFTLMIVLIEHIPLSVYARIRRKKDSPYLRWLIQRRSNMEAVKMEQLAEHVKDVVGYRAEKFAGRERHDKIRLEPVVDENVHEMVMPSAEMRVSDPGPVHPVMQAEMVTPMHTFVPVLQGDPPTMEKERRFVSD